MNKQIPATVIEANYEKTKAHCRKTEDHGSVIYRLYYLFLVGINNQCFGISSIHRSSHL